MKKFINLHRNKGRETPEMKGQRGSMTVELALIFPFIILTILSVIYIVIIFYQFAQLQSLVNITAEGASRGWGRIHSSKDITPFMTTGAIEKEEIETPLYWRLTLLDDTSMKERKIKEYLERQLENKSVLGIKDRNVEVKYKDWILHKEVNVSVAVRYEIPLPIIGGLNILGNQYRMEVTSKSLVKDPTELIRNIDFAVDLMDDFELTKTLKEQYNENLDLIKEKIGDLFQSE